MNKPTKWSKAVVAVAAAVSVCGVSTALAGASTQTSSGKKSPIIVGGIWSASSFAGADVGAQAVFTKFNDGGGLDGRKIKFVGMQDDGSSPAQSITAANTLINDGVVAVVPVVSAGFDASNVLTKAHVPWFGWGVTPNYGESPYGFSFIGSDTDPTGTTLVNSAAASCKMYASKMKLKNCRGITVAMVGENEPASVATVKSDAQEWKKLGAHVVLQQTTMPAQPAVISDFTPYADQIMTSANGKAPDIVDAPVSPTQSLGLNPALLHMGFKGAIIGYTLYDPRAVSIASGTYVMLQFAPWQQSSTAVSEMTAAVTAGDPAQMHNQATEAGYISAEMFVSALRKVGPNFTGQSLTAALNKGWSFGIPGLVGSVTYPAAHKGGQAGSAIVYSNGTAFTVALPLTEFPPQKR